MHYLFKRHRVCLEKGINIRDISTEPGSRENIKKKIKSKISNSQTNKEKKKENKK